MNIEETLKQTIIDTTNQYCQDNGIAPVFTEHTGVEVMKEPLKHEVFENLWREYGCDGAMAKSSAFDVFCFGVEKYSTRVAELEEALKEISEYPIMHGSVTQPIEIARKALAGTK